MSLTAQIGSSDATFKLAQKLVAALAEKYSFSFEDGWTVVSTRTVDNIQKRLKREKRRANPAAQVKHARTAFSFFTQQQRPVEQKAHPEATFGQLSRFVSEAWKKLSPAEMQKYKDMETADKSRYQTEKAAALESASAAAPAAEAAPAAAETASPKKARTPKAKAATPAAAPVAATPAPAAEKKAKTPKSAKAAAPAAAPAAPVAAAPAEKKAKAPKAAAAPAAAPVAAAPAAKAPKAKAVKA